MKRLSVLILLSLLGACAPTHHDSFEGLGSGSPRPTNAFKTLVVAEVSSKNRKAATIYTGPGKVLTFGTVNTTLNPGIERLLKDNFKSVIKADNIEQAAATGADLIVVVDVFAEAKRYGFGFPDFHWDAKLIFLKMSQEEIAVARGDSRKRSVIGGIIGMGGLLFTQMFTTAITNHAAEKEALALIEQSFAVSVRPRLNRFVLERQSHVGLPAVASAPAPAVDSDVDRPGYRLEPDPRNFALVIGVEKYKSLPEALYAEHDALAVYAHLRALGYPNNNIKYMTGLDATKSALQKNLESWLSHVAKEDSRIFFYFSGHGTPNPETGQAYIVPWDGDPQYLEETAYPVQKLYETLGALKARSVVIALDSCFSGAGGRSVLPKGMRPLINKIDVGSLGRGPTPMAALTASAGSQISGAEDDQAHGLFTYYLLKGLNGAASKNGQVTLGSLYDYLKPAVEVAAHRDNRNQTPQLMLRSAASDPGDLILR